VSETQLPSPEPIEDRGWETLAREAADADASAEGLDEMLQFLSFELDGAPYAVAVEQVREIVRLRTITPVPRVPDDVRGVISLRGEIIEVIDLGLRLGLPAVEPGRATRLIVTCDSEGRVAAMLVDRVREVLRVGADAIRPASGSESGAIESLCACGDLFVSVLELDRVLEFDA
jgi:purine-binding chemotaxis protein CheW